MRSNTKASDQRTLLLTVPMTVFPIPMVKIEVRVEAGVVSEVGTTAEFPTTIWIAKASPKARAIPKTTAVKIPERATSGAIGYAIYPSPPTGDVSVARLCQYRPILTRLSK